MTINIKSIEYETLGGSEIGNVAAKLFDEARKRDDGTEVFTIFNGMRISIKKET